MECPQALPSQLSIRKYSSHSLIQQIFLQVGLELGLSKRKLTLLITMKLLLQQCNSKIYRTYARYQNEVLDINPKFDVQKSEVVLSVDII